MIFKKFYSQAYVWIWLPQAEDPVVAGVLNQMNDRLVFNYGRNYLNNSDAIPIYSPELPLQSGPIPLLPDLMMPGCIRDASPDAWGRRVLMNYFMQEVHVSSMTHDLSELDYLLESGSDRIGALDFQESPTRYVPRKRQIGTLDELYAASEKVEKGEILTPELDIALQHGTSIGGARPKVLLESDSRQWIAKFSTSTDMFNLVKTEFLAMRLAEQVGLKVAHVELTKALGKDVLLIERFDRIKQVGWTRKALVSALTILELDEMMAPYASYEKLAEIVRRQFKNPQSDLKELFGRIVFNILCGNTDDHARNHAAFWDGSFLELTPAYDICPQSRTGQEATQAMLISGLHRQSNLVTCLMGAPQFLLSKAEAINIINHQIQVIQHSWSDICHIAQLSEVERRYLMGRQFLNPFAFFHAPTEIIRPAQFVG